MDRLLPRLAISLPETDQPSLTPADLFDNTFDHYWLEVGFGYGEHLATQAANNPDTGIIGSEVYKNGIASMLAHLTGTHVDGLPEGEEPKIHATREDNVRVYPEDVRAVLPHLKDASFDRIFVLFPDPWPKKRHAERRFIGPENLPVLARLLKDGGELRVASDDMSYIRWALQHLMADPNFVWQAETRSDWLTPPEDWVPTRYEQKARSQGKKPVYLRFTRISR